MLERNVVPSKGIEHLRGADDIGQAMSARVGQRLAGTRLGRQMHDDVRPHQLQHDVPSRSVADVERQERDARIQISRPARPRMYLIQQAVHRIDVVARILRSA